MFGFFKRNVVLPEHAVVSVADGNLVKLENVKDQAFAQKMLGDGIAIDPRNEYIVSPCKGMITMMYPTLHAFGITGDDGIEILVHIGIDTVKLNGKGFTRYVGEGSRVQPGDKIISFDPKYLQDEDLDLTTMVLFPGNEKTLKIKKEGYVRKGKDIIVTYE